MVLHTGCTEKKPIKINLFLIERNARSIDSFKKLFFFFFLIKRDFFLHILSDICKTRKINIFFSGKILVGRNFDSTLIQVCVFLRGTGFGKVQVFCHVFPNFMRCLSMFTLPRCGTDSRFSPISLVYLWINRETRKQRGPSKSNTLA